MEDLLSFGTMFIFNFTYLFITKGLTCFVEKLSLRKSSKGPMSRVLMSKFVTSTLLCIYIFFTLSILNACSDVVDADPAIIDPDEIVFSVRLSSSSTEKSSSSKALYPESFKPNDDEYPYAGIPRIVLETENRQKIKNRETEIPAKMQIWGKKEPESEILDLTIRGRGNTSWTDMPKKSYKIEFEKKQSMLDMPKDKEWALIANYADKTLLKNYLTYNLASWFGTRYSPKSDYVELYLNGEYLGVYLLAETIKKGKNRVDLNEDSFLAEFDVKQRANDVGLITQNGKKVTIHYPKDIAENGIAVLKDFIDSLDNVFANDSLNEKTLNKIIDIDDYIVYYWIQEFSKNKDGAFSTSVYFTWEPGKSLSMGPVWDFDLAYGGNFGGDVIPNGEWYIKNFYWNRRLFSEAFFVDLIKKYWNDHSEEFHSVPDSIKSYKKKIQKAAQNNFKRWAILDSTTNIWHNIAFENYDNAVDSLVGWVNFRLRWIEENLDSIQNKK